MHSDDHPGVIAPPPLIYLSALGLALLLDFLVYRVPTTLASEWRQLVAVGLAAAALPLLVGALGGFQRAGTRAEPWKPSTTIVRTGVYGLTRNPMYLAMSLIYLALGLLLDSGVALLLFGPLLLVIQRGVIEREERYLEQKFGEDYVSYKSAVRRWL